MCAAALVAALAFAQVAGCGAADDGPQAEGPETALQNPLGEPPSADSKRADLQFEQAGTFAFDTQGRTPTVTISLPASRRFVAIAAIPTTQMPASRKSCFALEEVDHAGLVRVVSGAWRSIGGEVCGTCTWPTRVGDGYGYWVLPSAAATLGPGDLTFRVRLRRCADTGFASRLNDSSAPPGVRLQYAHEAAVPATANGVVRVRVAVDPNASGGAQQGLNSPAWAAGWTRASKLLQQAGVRLWVEHLAALPRPAPDPLVYGRTERAALDLVSSDARYVLDQHGPHRYLPVVVVPCLKVSVDGATVAPTAGTVPRIPGGQGLGGFADAVLISDGLCRKDAPTPLVDSHRIGNLLAHEIGHFLGLYHSDTADGRMRLPAGPTPTTLMARIPLDLDDAPLTPVQRAVIRRHPVVGFASAP